MCEGRYLLEQTKDQKPIERVDFWLKEQAVPLALIILAVGFCFRIYYAMACYLNPDEIVNLDLAQAAGFKMAYLKSLTQAHPPLLTVVLHFFIQFGTFELLLRIPSLIAGTLGVWFGFKWSERVFGTGVAIGVLMLLTFSPAMTFTAIEVRSYGLLLGGICGALYGLERSYEEDSLKWMAFGHACLYAAILSHYSALWVTVAIGCYSILRLYALRAKRLTWTAWAGFQAGAILLYVVLYFTHIKYMRSGWMQNWAVHNYLKSGHFHGGDQSLLGFIGSGFKNVFSYLLGIHAAGITGVVLFVAGVMALLVVPAIREGEKRRDLAVLLATPLVLGCVGAIFHLNPFSGSRHSSYLLPFLAAGISLAVFRWVKYSAVLASLICLIGPAWLMWTISSPLMGGNNSPKWLPRNEMTRALEFLSAEVPVDRPLIVDNQTFFELKYYLGKNSPIYMVKRDENLLLKRIGERPVIYSGNPWIFSKKNFIPFVRKTKKLSGAKPGELLWAMSTLWYHHPPLKNAVPSQLLIRSKQFGQISLIQFKMPPEEFKKKTNTFFDPPVITGIRKVIPLISAIYLSFIRRAKA